MSTPLPGLADALRERQRALGAGPASLENVRRLGEGAACAVAGQQPGAAGLGPLYALHKAAAACALARSSGEVPVFWVAGDDHDHEEAVRVRFLASGGSLEKDRAPLEAPAGTPLNRIPATEALRSWLRALRDRLPATPERDPWFDRVLAACRGTWSDWTAALLLDLFRDEGLVILDPSWVRPQAAPLLARYARLRERSHAEMLAEAARHPEPAIDPVPETHLFGLVGGVRKRAAPAPDEVLREPGLFCPDVALRPVLQDFLLPGSRMVAGPGERAYLAQLGPLYRLLEVSPSKILPRPALTLLGPREAAFLRRKGLGPEAALLPPGDLRRRLAPAGGLSERIRALEASWDAELFALRKEASGLDPNLSRPGERTDAAVRDALEAFARKAAQSELRRSGEDAAHLEALERWVRPDGKPQERVLDAVGVLARFGPRLAGLLVRDVDWADPAPRALGVS